MKKILFLISLTLCIFLVACVNNDTGIINGANGSAEILVGEKGENSMYVEITATEAKKIMDNGDDYVVLDVREQTEFNAGHIPGSILIPYTQIDAKAETMLPNKDKQILVYCRSGRRSKIASESLAKLGYTNVKEFGGIIDWPYEVEK